MASYVEKMAEVIIHYSTAVQPGERMLIRSTSPAGEPLAQALYQAALRAGAETFTYIHLRDEDSLAIEASDDPDLLAAVNPMLKLMYETCQVVVRIDASENTQALSDYPADSQQARMQALGSIMSIQMEREGNGSLRRCSTQFPTQGYAQTAGVDLHYFDRAKAAGKRRLALESIDFQVGLFANLSREEDAEFLQYTLDELDTLIPTVDHLMAHWRSGHVAEVEALLTDAYREFPDLFRRLVSDRNRSWLPQIEALLAGDGSAMVVVGALHLVGEQGLVEQLRQRGFAVEQL